MESAIYNGWAVDVGAHFTPTIILSLPYEGGESELAAWDSTGALRLWAGTSGRTQPEPAPVCVGTLTLDVDVDDKTTIAGLFTDANTANLKPASHTYQWDVWDGAGVHLRTLRGTFQANGRAMP